jgi:hypothetical protein
VRAEVAVVDLERHRPIVIGFVIGFVVVWCGRVVAHVGAAISTFHAGMFTVPPDVNACDVHVVT